MVAHTVGDGCDIIYHMWHWVMWICDPFAHSDLEKSVEELQRNSSVNHGLVTEQDVEQKSKELRMLGETLTELKSKCCDLLHVSGDDAVISQVCT